ncbi:MAG: chemotaxis protein CheD [Sedimentisphaerales bacterium]|nr:chemotaxis protein CheD [Sedimentisphaerales bacterium]
MKQEINVHTGEVRISGNNAIIRTSALGSCVAVVAYDSFHKIGGLAHIMLPGQSPKSQTGNNQFKYAENAIALQLQIMVEYGAKIDRIIAVLAGGANVLNKPNDTICEDNIYSVKQTLAQANIPVRAEAIGANLRRSITLDVKEGCCYYTEGSSREMLLWNFSEEPQIPAGETKEVIFE